MIYAENILIFLVAPLVVGFFFLKGETKQFVGFFLIGTIVCLLCSYVNSFITMVTQTPADESVVRLTPIIEEIMKALPLFFYIAVFLPASESIWKVSIALGIGFATFENCCLVVSSGADNLSYMFVRGFSVGIMHILCSVSLGWALMMINTKRYLVGLCTFASLCICITYHSIYNLLVSSYGDWKVVGYFLPVITLFLVLMINSFLSVKNKRLKQKEART